MKLQFLGDARDAFKWDLLHWVCTTSSFSTLVYVPLLTRDKDGSSEGRILHHRFACQEFIRPFLESLKEEARSLQRIARLGTIHSQKQFEICIFAPEKILQSGRNRHEYWADFDASTFEKSVVFFDPDNGYETKTQKGTKWIRHSELRNLFAQLPETSVALVYQHKPHRTWVDLFADLAKHLAYVHIAAAVHESDLAFVGMAGNATAGEQITSAMKEYSDNHRDVNYRLLFGSSDAGR